MEQTTQKKKKREFRSPNSYLIIMVIIALVAVLSWILPGGAYDYVDPDASKLEPIAGTYHEVESSPQGLWAVFMAPINGFMDSVDIILYCLIIGGYISIVMKSGAFDASIGAVMRKMEGREFLLIPVLMLIFAIAGAAFGIEEETLPFFLILIPVFILAGYDSLVGISVIKVGAALGVMASVANPFAVAIASNFAGIPMTDGIGIRIVLLCIFIPSGIIYTMMYAKKIKNDPTQSLVYAQKQQNEEFFLGEGYDKDALPEFTTKRKLILVIFALSFIVMIWGVLSWEDLGITIWPTMWWWFGELSCVFVIASLLVGIIEKMPVDTFMDTFIKGASELLGVAMIIGVARGVAMIMHDAMITDTILHYCENAVASMGGGLFAGLNYIVFLILSFFIPSSSGLATLSMGIMAPLADFAGVGREIVIIAYQSANSMIALVAPTCGLLMGVLAMTRTSFGTWIRFVWKLLVFIAIVTVVVLAGASMILY